jgi:hypothetical protein
MLQCKRTPSVPVSSPFSTDLDMRERIVDGLVGEEQRAVLKEAYARVLRHTSSNRETFDG